MGRFRILLADDHAFVLQRIQAMLEPEYEVVGAVGDGESLVEAALDLHPDVIVSDISMPILGGIEAAQRLQSADQPFTIIFLTLHEEPALVTKALAVGAAGYVLKRRAPIDLPAAIRETLSGRVYVSPEIAKPGV